MALQDPVRVGATIRTIRELIGTSRGTLASQIHISAPHLANIEAGRRGCTFDVARRIAAALSVDLIAITSESEH